MKKNTAVIIIFILLLAVAAYLYFSSGSSTIKKELGDFAVEDTASITKIFLVDNDNKSILLERIDAGKWMVNGKYEARTDAINVLLTTIKRVSLKTPVPKSEFETVVKQIASKHVKVEIYLNSSDKAVKVYYVGHANPEHTGTFMLLEGSSVPFLMHIEGFRGFLTPRYFTNEYEWRSSAIFNYSFGDISSIKMEYPAKPENSFIITDLGNSTFSLKDIKNNEVSGYDTAALLQYIALYQKIHYESFEETTSPQFIDSISSTQPEAIITVTDKSGRAKTVKTFLKPAKEGATDLEGSPIIHDVDRFYGLINNKDFVVLQYFVFDPILKTLADFRKKQEKKS